MIDWTKPVRVMDSHEPVQILCTTRDHVCNVVGLISNRSLATWNETGVSSSGSQWDVENVPEEEKYTFILYRSTSLHPNEVCAARNTLVSIDSFEHPVGQITATIVNNKISKVDIDQ